MRIYSTAGRWIGAERHSKISQGAAMYGRKCRCRPATPAPKAGVLLLHYILYIPALGYGKLDPRLSQPCRINLRYY